MTSGYVVIDTETTGLFPKSHRVIEVAAVALRPDGSVEGEWSTLLNPERDLGPVGVHQIRARDLLSAPRFVDIAGDLAELLGGRVIVGHNVSFDVRFIQAEYHRAGHTSASIPAKACLDTMMLAGEVLPLANRKLETCCARAGIANRSAHSALSDAQATAELLRYLAPAYGGFGTLSQRINAPRCLASVQLPSLPRQRTRTVHRGEPVSQDVPFWSRIAATLPAATGPEAETEYLALLDRALLDRVLSVREANELVSLAAELGIDQQTAYRLNSDYLSALARAALADSLVTQDELKDLVAVAQLLGLGEAAVQSTLDAQWAAMKNGPRAEPAVQAAVKAKAFALTKGDLVVFTGETVRPRPKLESLAATAGLVPYPRVTKKVKLVVAADPDSLSGKARKAADYQIPIVTEDAFLRLLPGVR